ncbi:MAG: hypothetical protein IPG71_02620 [bacterium]|nr:hypothetical protein [bacterium]
MEGQVFEDGMRMRVIQSYTKTYPDPIRGTKGDALKIGEPDVDNPDWIWCVGTERRWGWVHHSVIDRGSSCLKEDYDACELDVSLGMKVEVGKILSGWAWCSAETGEAGWVPINCLEERMT